MIIYADDDLFGGADLAAVDASDHYALIPAGEYLIQGISAEPKDTKGGGKRIACVFEIVAGEYQGRKLFEGFNTKHHNGQAVEIALKGIKQWVMAAGGTGEEKLSMALIDALMGKEVIGYVSISNPKAGSEYGPQNQIRSFSRPEGGGKAAVASAKPAAPKTQKATERTAPTVKRPWEKDGAAA